MNSDLESTTSTHSNTSSDPNIRVLDVAEIALIGGGTKVGNAATNAGGQL